MNNDPNQHKPWWAELGNQTQAEGHKEKPDIVRGEHASCGAQSGRAG